MVCKSNSESSDDVTILNTHLNVLILNLLFDHLQLPEWYHLYFLKECLSQTQLGLPKPHRGPSKACPWLPKAHPGLPKDRRGLSNACQWRSHAIKVRTNFFKSYTLFCIKNSSTLPLPSWKYMSLSRKRHSILDMTSLTFRKGWCRTNMQWWKNNIIHMRWCWNWIEKVSRLMLTNGYMEKKF